MTDYNLKVITPDTDGPSADTELLFGAPDQASGTPKSYSFAGVKMWTKSWNGIMVHPGYKAGNWYFGAGIATGATQTSNALVLNTMYLFPFYIPQKITLSELAVNVITLIASSNCQLAIYNSNPSNPTRPGTLVGATDSFATATAGNKSITFTGSATYQLGVGWYFFAVNSDISGVALSTNGPTSLTANQTIGAATLATIMTGGGNSNALQLSIAQTYNTWPDLTSATIVEAVAQQRAPIPVFKVLSVP